MIFKTLGLIASGAVLTATIPSIASTKTEAVTLTPGQIEFIKQLDSATGKNFSSLAKNPGAVSIIKSATVACGNVDVQKQFVISAGGNPSQAEYASKKFETLFCQNKV